ncbi:hypothetical protein T11_16806 [Trichinella zimbabwensis]|uniref:Uncharacterized protein n=1 Tax=Trichinella zimbabwensis TaxID=268475 RepID=A0A0V1DR99_9BILA|nr:hypothetical protein T11_16806 [Trichinella zimbabwensis]
MLLGWPRSCLGNPEKSCLGQPEKCEKRLFRIFLRKCS